MKYAVYIAAFMALNTGCQQRNVAPETVIRGQALQNAACAVATPVVKRVRERVGTIGRIGNTDVYFISYHIPGTIDAQDVGIVCNLPDVLKEVGRSVTFDGEYRAYDKSSYSFPAGTTLYHLTLTKIRYVP